MPALRSHTPVNASVLHGVGKGRGKGTEKRCRTVGIPLDDENDDDDAAHGASKAPRHTQSKAGKRAPLGERSANVATTAVTTARPAGASCSSRLAFSRPVRSGSGADDKKTAAAGLRPVATSTMSRRGTGAELVALVSG